MDIFRFDRADRIGTEVVMGVVWLATALSLLVEPVGRWIEGQPLLLDVEGQLGAQRISLDDPTSVDRLLALAAPALAVVFLGIGAWLVIRVMRDIAGGVPFTRTQVRRLRQLAFMMLTVPVVAGVAAFIATAEVQQRLGRDVDVTFTVPFGWLLAGLLTAAVAQAFSDGASLSDDVRGLV